MGLFGGKKKKQVIGYRYHIGMHMIAGHAHMDGVERIRCGEKVAWTHSNVLKDSHTNVITSYPVTGKGWSAQTFITTSRFTLDSVELMLYIDIGNTPGILTCSIRATDVDGHPTGDDLCVATTDGDTLPTVYAMSDAEWREFEFTAPVILESGTKYAIVLHATDSNASSDTVKWIASNDSSYANGNLELSLDAGVTWAASGETNVDMVFKCYKKDGSAPNSTISIDNDSLFGGNKSEGGVKGSVDVMFGEPDQTQNTYLKARLDDDIPAYRGVFGVVLNQVYIGTSSYLRHWSFLCKRVCKQIDGSTQWYKEKAVIRPREVDGDDLNAIHIIRECLIAPEWGLGWNASDIDEDSFKEAANILYDEGFGLSMLWDQVEPMEDFVDEVLNYITGILYQDLSTGQWVISLTRDNAYGTAYDGKTTGDNNQGLAVFPGTRHFAQSFTPTRSYTVDSCKVKIYKSALGTIDVRCELQGVDANGHPDGIAIAQGTILTADISETASWVSCDFSKKAALTIDTQYALVVKPIDGIGTLYWRVDTFSDCYTGFYLVSNDTGSTWTHLDQSDFLFEIFAGGALESFDETQITAIEDFSRPAYGEITDAVTVKFWDKLNHKTRSTEDRDIALIAKQNGIVIEKILNYQGICNEGLANDVAARELKLVTQMLAGVRLRCTRAMSHLKPNDVFLFSWDDLGITQMALRVLNADYGDLQQNRVILVCAEDEFGAAATIYGAAPETEMSDPVSDAVDVTLRQIIEIPYWSLVNDILESKDLVDALDDDYTRMAIVAAKPVDDAYDFDLFTRFTAAYEYIDVGQGNTLFCPAGTLTDGLVQDNADIDITMATSIDLDDVSVGSFAIIGSEYVLINSVDTATGIVNISRGVLDTTPVQHSAGAVIYFAGLHYSEVADEFTAGDAPDAKLLTRTGSGSLDIDDATALSASAFGSRMIRPYPPGNIKFNAVAYPSYFSSGAHSNQVQVTWNARDRGNVTQLNSFVKQNQANNYGPEATSTVTIKIYGEDGVTLGRTVTGEGAGPYDYTETFEIADFGSLQKSLRFVIYSVRGLFDSWNDGHDITIKRSMIGTVSAVSNLTGDLEGYFEGVIAAISGAVGNINVLTLLTGSIAEISNISGGIGFSPELIGSVSSVSNSSGSLSFLKGISGSVAATSSTTGALIVHEGSPAMAGSVAASSETTGALTVPSVSVLKDHMNIDDDGAAANGKAAVSASRWEGQSWNADSSYTCKSTKLLMSKNSENAGKFFTVYIYNVSAGVPSGAAIASGTISAADILESAVEGAWAEIDLGVGCSIISGQDYAVMVKSDTTDMNVWVDTSSNDADGSRIYSADSGANFAAVGPHEVLFETWGG